MIRTATWMLLAGALGATGCQSIDLDRPLAPNRGTTRALGDVSYQEAFATSRQVLAANSFLINEERTDANAGRIVTAPKAVDAPGERLLGNSPARQIATMEISQEAGRIVAQLVVEQQRQGGTAFRNMGYARMRDPESYSGNPGDVTPADIEGATTAQQNEAWDFEKDDHAAEARILDEIVRALQGS